MIQTSVIPSGLIRSDDLVKPLQVISEPTVDKEIKFGESNNSQVFVQPGGSWFQYDSTGERIVRCEITTQEFIVLTPTNNVIICRYTYSISNPSVRILAVPWDSVGPNDFVLCQALYRGTLRTALLTYFQYFNGLRALSRKQGPSLKFISMLEASNETVNMSISTDSFEITSTNFSTKELNRVKVNSQEKLVEGLEKGITYMVYLSNESTTDPTSYVLKVEAFTQGTQLSQPSLNPSKYPIIYLAPLYLPVTSGDVGNEVQKYKSMVLTQKSWEAFIDSYKWITLLPSLIYPVGCTYTQYPEDDGQFSSNSEPSILFGGRWTMIHNHGVFFRTSGWDDNAINESRSNGIQTSAIYNLNGQFYIPHINLSESGASGVFAADFEGNKQQKFIDVVGNPVSRFEFNFNASNQTQTTTREASRPRNMLIQIWRRIA